MFVNLRTIRFFLPKSMVRKLNQLYFSCFDGYSRKFSSQDGEDLLLSSFVDTNIPAFN